MSNAREVFTEIYRSGAWGRGSGGGSTPEMAQPYIALVEKLIRERKVTRVLDIGCGDGLLASAIDWQGARYHGIEVVDRAAAFASQRMPNATISCMDIFALPFFVSADLVLLKEVTQHLTNADVKHLVNLCREYASKCQMHGMVLHCSTVYGVTNSEIEMGQTRGVNLSLPPFSLPCKTVLEYSIGETKYICQTWEPE